MKYFLIPTVFNFNSSTISLINSENREVDKQSPCRTPNRLGKKPVRKPLTLTLVQQLEYMFFILSYNTCGQTSAGLELFLQLLLLD